MARKVKADHDTQDEADQPQQTTAEQSKVDPVADVCAVCNGMDRAAIAATLRSAWARMK